MLEPNTGAHCNRDVQGSRRRARRAAKWTRRRAPCACRRRSSAPTARTSCSGTRTTQIIADMVGSGAVVPGNGTTAPRVADAPVRTHARNVDVTKPKASRAVITPSKPKASRAVTTPSKPKASRAVTTPSKPTRGHRAEETESCGRSAAAQAVIKNRQTDRPRRESNGIEAPFHVATPTRTP
jgi:hypothetical protein